MYPPQLHLEFRVAEGFSLFGKLTHPRMPDVVLAHRISGLPQTSFRFRLATDPIASGYALSSSSCARDFHPLERTHLGRTKIKPSKGDLEG